jgi:uncharacterized protein
MPVQLLDVNALIAFAWSHHVHHGKVRAWFGSQAADGWATCPMTQAGFVRVSSNPTVMGAAATPRQAILALEQLVAHADHQFWPDDVMMTDGTYVPHTALRGHRQVVDAYLVGLALRHGGKLVTLDQGIASLLNTRREQDAVVFL